MKSMKTALKVRNSVILDQGSICHFVVGFFLKDVLDWFVSVLFKVMLTSVFSLSVQGQCITNRVSLILINIFFKGINRKRTENNHDNIMYLLAETSCLFPVRNYVS